jgi:alpha-L-fucosidase
MAQQSEQMDIGEKRLTWYQEAKFGLFIHWGIYTAAGVEASWPIMAPDLSEAMFGTTTRISETDYVKLAGKFNPVDFDADVWVRIAKEFGMRYMVITSKHHDGFCMFDAPGTDYKITNTPFGRDICLELSQACAKVGMPLGFYYSPPDMHHSGYRDTGKPATQNWLGEPNRKEWSEYLDYMESHIRKLLTGYGHVSILWFDGLVNHGKYDPKRFHKMIHELSPNTLINDRLGDDYDFITPEQFIPRKGIPLRTGRPPSGNDPGGDGFFRLVTLLFKIPGIRGFLRKQLQKYGEGELELTQVLQERYPSPERFQPWETCMTMGRSWAFNPIETDWKTPQTLLRNLVYVVSRGGNYLLNVGPTALGTFPNEGVDRLQHIGRWMAIYHETIYGNTYTPLQGLPWGQATRKKDKIYLHVFHWPSNNMLVIDAFPGTALSASLFAGEPLAFSQYGPRLEISVPPQATNPDVSVLVVEINSSEPGWNNYSHGISNGKKIENFLRTQMINNLVINSFLNGLIAYFAYRSRTEILFPEAAIDILITVGIIAFLVGWIGIGLARQEVAKGNLPREYISSPKLPKGAGARGLVISLICVFIYGGLLLDSSIFLISPGGFSNWAYILFKTMYTGVCASLASLLAILSVLGENNKG